MSYENKSELEKKMYDLASKIEEKRIATKEMTNFNEVMETLIKYGKQLDGVYIKESTKTPRLIDEVERLGLCYNK